MASSSLSLDRRKLLHVHTADRPGALWALRQVRYAVEIAGERVRCLIRDNDGIYGDAFSEGVRADGLKDHRISPRSPWQNGHVERLIGTLRRELLDHVIVLNSWHLLRLLDEFKKYYNRDRPHAALDQVPPEPREVHPPAMGKVVALPRLGGLHNRYERRKAA